MKVRGRARECVRTWSGISALRHARIEYEIAVALACQPRLDNTELERTTVLILMTDSRTGIETDTESREPLPCIGLWYRSINARSMNEACTTGVR